MSTARSLRGLASVAVMGILGAVLAAAPARADAPDPDAARLTAAGHSLKWNWTPPGRTERFGHAETLIHAPVAAVRRVLLDFPHYKDLTQDGIKTARVVGHQPDGSVDVYIQMGVMNDMLTFWNVTRFAPVHSVAEGVEVLEGKMIPGRGNIDDSAAVWTMRAVGPEWTVLKFDVLLRPGLPAPQSTIDNELRESAVRAVDSVHDRAQGSKDFQPYGG